MKAKDSIGKIVVAKNHPDWGQCVVVGYSMPWELIIQEIHTDKPGKIIRHYARCGSLVESQKEEAE